jgi:hypothetical protein
MGGEPGAGNLPISGIGVVHGNSDGLSNVRADPSSIGNASRMA